MSFFKHSMDAFPSEAIQGMDSTLTGAITFNSIEHSLPRLGYSLEVDLKPFILKKTVQNTTLKLNQLPLSVRSWRALADTVFHFPQHSQMLKMADGVTLPGDDQAYGAIQLLNTIVPVACTRIAFSTLQTNSFNARLDLQFQLADIDVADVQLTLETPLHLGAIRVVGDRVQINKPDAEAAHVLAARFLDLNDYIATSEDGIISYYPLL